MQFLNGKNIALRALEPEDLDFLYEIENDTSVWEISHTQTPFSKFILKQYLENAHLDIYEAKQLRLIIQTKEKKAIGMIDLFDFNPQHKRAGIGVFIEKQHQQNGYAKEALTILVNYAFSTLNLHQVFANITKDNTASLKLFKGLNFKEVGVKKDWIYSDKKYKDEILLQLLND